MTAFIRQLFSADNAPLYSAIPFPYIGDAMRFCPIREIREPAASAARPLFAFDLDGTVTKEELLPRIAALAGKERETAELTRQTLAGDIPFADSLRLRVAMLADIPVEAVRACVASVPLDPAISAFISARRDDCVIVTGNLDLWVAPLIERLGCRFFASRGVVRRGRVRVLSILDKAEAAKRLRREGRFLVAVGESVSDEPLFRRAHCGIAYGGVHEPVPGLLALAGHVVRDGGQLCSLLTSLERTKEPLPCGG